MYSDTDLAWAAGFLDGEGCIGIYVRTREDRGWKNPQHCLMVSVYNTEPAPLLKFKQMFGGNITSRHRESETHRRGGVWLRQDQKAAEVLRLIRPYLVGKADQADVALEFSAHRKLSVRPFGGLTPDILAVREDFRKRISDLKRVDYHADDFWSEKLVAA